ncbi:MAG: Cilia- and flagella-associated protein 20 [Marteilia pararefringens]
MTICMSISAQCLLNSSPDLISRQRSSRAQLLEYFRLAMFRNTYQNSFLSILYSIGSKPLALWHSQVRNGHLKRITDEDIRSLVLELMSSNVTTTYLTCPAETSGGSSQSTLGIKLPFLVMIVKNMKKYFTFEVQVLDDKGERRRFRASNYQTKTR